MCVSKPKDLRGW